jgi:hypothetical protein
LAWPSWLREGQRGELGGGDGAWRWAGWRCWARAGSGVQSFGGAQCSGGLGGVLLGLAEFGDGFGERGQLGDEQDRGHRPVLSEGGECGYQPGGLP